MSRQPEPLRVVLDTNVYIQAFMRPGSYLDVLIRRARDAEQVRLYSSSEIMLELRRKAEAKFGFTAAESAELARVCAALGSVVEPKTRLSVVARDPDDNKILECALEARAQLIVSADRDLLRLKQYQTMAIAHPAMLKYWFTERRPGEK